MILNQPVFETILSFIISQNNNITRIQSIISNMCNPTFPSRDELLDWTVERWEELGVGDKVANCIALFSLREYSSFPIDVHIKQRI